MNKFYKITAVGKEKDCATIELFGEVCEERPVDFWTGERLEGNFIALDDFRKAIKEISNAKNLTIKLNSFGGDLFAGKAIFDELKSLKAEKTVEIMGVAMSAATVIMLAGDKVIANEGDIIMIHEAKATVIDNFDAEQAQRLTNSLTTCNKAMAELYAKKCGKSVQTILNAMHSETWFTAEQAKEYGLIDEVREGVVSKIAASFDYSKIYANGKEIDLQGLRIPKEFIKILPVEKVAETFHVENKVVETNNIYQEVKEMEIKTTAELKAAYPELVENLQSEVIAKAVAEAKKQERARIKEIEEIEATLCMSKEDIENAKYGDSEMNARDIAFINAKQQAKIGAVHLSQMQQDTIVSGANEIVADGNIGYEKTATKEEKLAKEAQAFFSNAVEQIKKETIY